MITANPMASLFNDKPGPEVVVKANDLLTNEGLIVGWVSVVLGDFSQIHGIRRNQGAASFTTKTHNSIGMIDNM